MDITIPNDLFYAIATVAIAFMTYLMGKNEGRDKGINDGIEKTIEYLRMNNMVRWQYDDNGEINLLDINGKEVMIDD